MGGSFIAAGGEYYLTIGNFNDDSQTNSVLVNPASPNIVSYYYIDDVYVGSCDTTTPPPSFLDIPNIFTPNNDGQNDLFGITSGNLQSLNAQIYDRWGGKVWELKNPDDSWDGYNQSGKLCSAGVYYYVVTAKGLDGIAYHRTGFLQLIR